MAFALWGPRMWSVKKDTEGHREYTLKQLVVTEDSSDGPALALQTPGLPLPGAIWNFGNDIDLWATCKQEMTAEPHEAKEGQRGYWFIVTNAFSTKSDSKRCKDTQIEDPLLEAPKISGGSTHFTEEATFDRYGEAILNSAFEQIRGPQVEFDKSRSEVNIEFNSLSLALELISPLVDTVNDATMWGHDVRCVKLSKHSWEVKYYGSCYKYFTHKFTFEINDDGFDRTILDEGTKVLRGGWDTDPNSATYTDWVPDLDADATNPLDFIRFFDWNGNVCRVILNGAGEPVDTGIGTGTISPTLQGSILVQKYDESDFIGLLGLPVSLN